MLVTSKVKVSHISVVLQHLHLEDSFVAEFSFFTGFLILCPPQYCSPPCNHRLRRMRLHPQKQHPQSPSVSVNNCVSVFSLLAAEIMANRLTTQSKTQQAIYIIIFFFFPPVLRVRVKQWQHSQGKICVWESYSSITLSLPFSTWCNEVIILFTMVPLLQFSLSATCSRTWRQLQ